MIAEDSWAPEVYAADDDGGVQEEPGPARKRPRMISWKEVGEAGPGYMWIGEVQYGRQEGSWRTENIYVPRRTIPTPLHIGPVEDWTGRRRIAMIRQPSVPPRQTAQGGDSSSSSSSTPAAAPRRPTNLPRPGPTGRGTGSKSSGAAGRKRAAERAEAVGLPSPKWTRSGNARAGRR